MFVCDEQIINSRKIIRRVHITPVVTKRSKPDRGRHCRLKQDQLKWFCHQPALSKKKGQTIPIYFNWMAGLINWFFKKQGGSGFTTFTFTKKECVHTVK